MDLAVTAPPHFKTEGRLWFPRQSKPTLPRPTFTFLITSHFNSTMGQPKSITSSYPNLEFSSLKQKTIKVGYSPIQSKQLGHRWCLVESSDFKIQFSKTCGMCKRSKNCSTSCHQAPSNHWLCLWAKPNSRQKNLQVSSLFLNSSITCKATLKKSCLSTAFSSVWVDLKPLDLPLHGKQIWRIYKVWSAGLVAKN